MKRRGQNGQGGLHPHVVQGDYGTSTDSLQSLAESVGLGSVVDAQGNADLARLTPTWMNAIVEELSQSSGSSAQRTSGGNTRRRRHQSRSSTTPRTRRQARREAEEQGTVEEEGQSSDGEDSATEDLRTLARLVRKQYDRLMGGSSTSDEL